jgi:hypothetical protein
MTGISIATICAKFGGTWVEPDIPDIPDIPDVPVDLGGYYVSPDGDDGDDGSFESPWATLQHAMDSVVEGDIVYLRGGTYDVTTAQAITSNPGLVGTAENPICFYNYPGEVPIIDGTTKVAQGHGITLYYSSFVEFRGIIVANHAQFSTSSYPSGFNIYYCTDITFYKLVAGSDLIGAGVDVSLVTDGAGEAWHNPPSMGAFEI